MVSEREYKEALKRVDRDVRLLVIYLAQQIESARAFGAERSYRSDIALVSSGLREEFIAEITPRLTELFRKEREKYDRLILGLRAGHEDIMNTAKAINSALKAATKGESVTINVRPFKFQTVDLSAPAETEK
jgi:P2-related tail formation protein